MGKERMDKLNKTYMETQHFINYLKYDFKKREGVRMLVVFKVGQCFLLKHELSNGNLCLAWNTSLRVAGWRGYRCLNTFN